MYAAKDTVSVTAEKCQRREESFVGTMRHTNGHLQPLVATVVSLFLFFLSPSAVGLGFNETAGDDSTKLSFFFPLVPGIHSDLVGVMEKLIDKFNDENPGIHVEDTYLGSYTDVHAKVVDLVEAGTPPDVAVLNVNAMVGLVQKNAIAPLTDYINKAGGRGFLDQFYSSLLVHEPVYGLPMMRSTPVLYVNTDLLKEAGIDSPPTTWQQLVDDYAPITNYFLDKDIHALAIPDTWTDWIFGAFSRQAGSQLIKNDWITATFNSEGNSEALNLWVELTNKGIVPSPLVPWSNAINLFVRGKVAMLYYTTGGISRIKSSPANFTWEAVFCPAGPAGYGVEEGGADLHIFKNIPKKNQDAAWKLITFLTSPEIAATWSAASGYIAVNKESYNTYIMDSVVQETPAYLVARDQFQYAHPQMMSKNINEVRNVVNGNLNDALTGGKTVVEALEDGQAGLIRIIFGDHQLGLPTWAWATIIAGTVITLVLTGVFFIIRIRRINRQKINEYFRQHQEVAEAKRDIEANIERKEEEVDEMRKKLAKLEEQPFNPQEMPSTWTGSPEILVEVKPNEPEYQEVSYKLQNTMEDAIVTKLYRVQNQPLWIYYNFHKQRFRDSGMTDQEEEINVWHGTRGNDPIGICEDKQDGFFTGYARKGLWGRGLYFADKSCYSDEYAFCRRGMPMHAASGEDSSGPLLATERCEEAEEEDYELILSLLLLGKAKFMEHPSPDLKVPPTIDSTSSLRFNTVCGYTKGKNGVATKVWVVYENGRVYPNYLVRYKRKAQREAEELRA